MIYTKSATKKCMIYTKSATKKCKTAFFDLPTMYLQKTLILQHDYPRQCSRH